MSKIEFSAIDSFVTFSSTLDVKLDLEVDGEKGEVFASHIEEVNLHMHRYGFEGQIVFTTFNDDKIHALFALEKTMKIKLSFLSIDPKKVGIPLQVIQGIVFQRDFKVRGSKKDKKHSRSYTFRFADPAKVSWESHYPMKIFVDKTMKDVLDAEKNPLISINKFELETLNETKPILAFNLSWKNSLPQNLQVSFYSFVMWYLEQAKGTLEYNIKENNYAILGKKSENGTPIDIPEWSITPARCQYPEPSRYHPRIIKHSASNIEQKDEDNPHGFDAVRKESFDDTNHHLFPEQIHPQTLSPAFFEKPCITFSLLEFTETMTLETIVPGTIFTIKGDESKGLFWCQEPEIKDKQFRICDISLILRKLGETKPVKQPVQAFQIEYQVIAESKEESLISRPYFNPPVYPFSIPGKVFCSSGEKEQTTFNIVKHEKSPTGYYQIVVPLAGKENKLVVPFTPDISSGQYYFPLCKDQEVMLSVYFQTAKIEKVLDWQPLVRLPLETQANQIVLGSNGKDKYTLQKHEYQGSDPTFTLIQSTSADQTQTIQIQDKKLSITVMEKGKHTVSIELDRNAGLTLKLKDDSTGVTQQTIYSSESIVHTSDKSGTKSTITQKPDAISIECKTLQIQCEEGLIECKKSLTNKAGSKITLDTPTAEATGKFSAKG